MRTYIKSRELSRAEHNTFVQATKQMILLGELQERAIKIKDRTSFDVCNAIWSAMIESLADHDEPLKRKLEKVADMCQVEGLPKRRDG
jgi:hypothetical protein